MLGEAGSRVVLEECLEGDELSFLVFSDGERVAPLVAAQDHKRVGDGDSGPNTGGMGAYSTQTIIDDKMRDWLLSHVARPVVAGMKAEGAEFKGVLYCGLMMTARGPMVLEFNCRFGDPETQPILMRLESDLVEALEASVDGRISEGDFKWSRDAAVCVVMASGGYPGTFEVGKEDYGIGRCRQGGRCEGLPRGNYEARWRILHGRRAGAGSDGARRGSGVSGGAGLRGRGQNWVRECALSQGYCVAGAGEEMILSFLAISVIPSGARNL